MHRFTKVFGFKELRVADRLFLNSDYIRGFDKVGITDSDSGDLIGGTTRIAAGGEVDFPVFLPKSSGIKGSVFTSVARLSGTPQKRWHKHCRRWRYSMGRGCGH